MSETAERRSAPRGSYRQLIAAQDLAEMRGDAAMAARIEAELDALIYGPR